MSYNIICAECENDFLAKYPNTKVCSATCRSNRYTSRTGRSGKGLRGYSGDIPSGTVGAISEFAVCAFFMKRGYAVFRAVSQSCFCDLVVFKDKPIKIEVKTGYQNKDTGNVMYPKSKHENIDVYAICERNTGEIFFFTKEGEPLEL